MPLFDWIRSDLHSLNLDWIINKIKTVEESEQGAVDAAADAKSSKTAAAASATAANNSKNAAAGSATLAAVSAQQAQNLVDQLDTTIAQDVSDWLDEHITPTTPAVDDTLTVSGAAADAAVTGNKITELKTDLNSFPFAETPSDSKAFALTTITFVTNPIGRLRLAQIYKKYSNVYAIVLIDESNNRYNILNAAQASYTEPSPDDTIYFSYQGISGFYRINWSLITDGTVVNAGNVYFHRLTEPNKLMTEGTFNYNFKNIPADSLAVKNAINKVYSELSYPFNKPINPIKSIKLNTYNKRTLSLVQIYRNGTVGANTIHAIVVNDGVQNLNFLNVLSASYTESEEVSFNVGGYSGKLYIDWNKVPNNTSTLYNSLPFSNSIFDLADKVIAETYPYTAVSDSPVYDIWFKTYDNTKKYSITEIGRNVATGGNTVYYVRITDGTTNYLLLNVLSSGYTEKAENNFSLNGGALSGTFWIDWSKITSGTFKYYTGVFSDLCYSISNIRTDVDDLKNDTEDVEVVIPDTIYGVVGHPFSIYYYNIFKKDSLEDYHFSITGSSSHVENMGDRIRFACDTAGSYPVTIMMRKDSTNTIASKTITVNILAENIPTIKAMFIGDSFVDVGTMQAELKHLMGNSLTFYGTRSSVTTDSTGASQTILDEGRSGWSWANYCTLSEKNNITNAFWDGTEFNFSYYMQNNSSFNDVTDVFLLSGPNDNSPTDTNYRTYYQFIVDSIKEYSENIRIHCMMPLTCVCTGYAWGIRNYNSAEEFRYNMMMFGKAVMDMFTSDSQCYVIPTHVNFDRIYDFARTQVAVNDRTPTLIDVFDNNVHPNEYGYYCMADMIFGNIVANCQ